MQPRHRARQLHRLGVSFVGAEKVAAGQQGITERAPQLLTLAWARGPLKTGAQRLCGARRIDSSKGERVADAGLDKAGVELDRGGKLTLRVVEITPTQMLPSTHKIPTSNCRAHEPLSVASAGRWIATCTKLLMRQSTSRREKRLSESLGSSRAGWVAAGAGAAGAVGARGVAAC